MKVHYVLIILCVVGAAVPLAVAIPWLMNNNYDLWRLLSQPFSTGPGTLFGWDLTLSAITLIVFILSQRRELGSLWFLPLLATCCVGVSFGLPLMLLQLLRNREAGEAAS